MSIDQLTTCVIEFSTTLNEETQPQLTIAAIDLYCVLLTRFLQDQEGMTVEGISVNFIINANLLSNLTFVE